MYKIMKKWDGIHTEISRDFPTMSAANNYINQMIAFGTLAPTQGEHREYYIIHQDETDGERCTHCSSNRHNTSEHRDFPL